MRYFGWLWVGLLGTLSAVAQVPYGNEWIQPSQQYLRLGIAQTGWYRLAPADLQQWGLDLSRLPATSLQLFRRGQEVSIRVHGEEDNRLDDTDYIEFYAEGNDGWPDTLLYVEPQALPHPYYSLYSDTAAYFLTWRTDGVPGQRIQTLPRPSDVSSALSYHQENILQLFTNEYPAGNIYPAGAGYEDGYILTPYDYGEGWTGPVRLTSQWGVIAQPLQLPYRDRLDQASVELLLVGRSSGEHRVEIWTGNATRQGRKLGELTWKGYAHKVFKASFLPDDLQPDGSLSVAFVPRVPGESVSASYVRWAYPQLLAGLSTFQQKILYPTSQVALDLASLTDLRYFDVSVPRHPRQLFPAERGYLPAQGAQAVLAVREAWPVPSLRPVKFHPLPDSGRIDYLIITHPLVREPTPDSPDPVMEYASYRASARGGGHVPLVLNASEVADQFNYGEPGPAGTQRLMRWLHQRGKLKYVFLVGRSRSPQIVRKQANARQDDMVSSAGWPDSDIALGMGLDARQPHVPLVPIGRLNAYTSHNVWDYLQKVKQHEAAPATAPWRKNVLHLSGGRSAYELDLFRNFVEGYASRIVASPVAPVLRTLSKKTDQPVERFPIAPLVNEGVALMTLFGHSSLSVTDIDIGFASNNALGYANKGRYPAVVVNGCALGNFYFGPTPISTDWILAPNRGAILFLAHTHNGLAGPMHAYSQQLYGVLADPAFTSQSFGNIMQETLRRYMSSSTQLDYQVTAQQMNLQGDPAIAVFPATGPDYAWIPSSVQLLSPQGKAPSTWDDSLRLTGQLANYGRFKEGIYTVSVRRSQEGKLLEQFKLSRKAFTNRDSIAITLPNTSRQSGSQTWELTLIAENGISEEDTTNNTFILKVLMNEGGALALLPADQALLISSRIELIAQVPAGRKGEAIVFEWDHTPTFATARRDTVHSSSDIVRKNVDLSGPEPQTIYWKVYLVGDSPTSTRRFHFNPAGTATGSLPEGVARLKQISPAIVEEGAPLQAHVTFENISSVPFKDSIEILVREFFQEHTIDTYLKLSPLGAGNLHSYTYERTSRGRPGLNRTLFYFNSASLPEQTLANNTLELRWEVLPDRTPPVLDVLIDHRRIRYNEVVSPQPAIQIRLIDSNPYLLRSDTTGLRVSLSRICDGCPETLFPLEKAVWSSQPATAFLTDLTPPTLSPGTYRLRIVGQDVAGNATAPYQAQFRITDVNTIASASASPNPAEIWVRFALELEGKTPPEEWRVQIYDLSGKPVVTLRSKPNLGQNELFWIPAGVAQGIYVYSMEVSGNEWPAAPIATGRLLINR